MSQRTVADDVDCFSWEQKFKALEFNTRASEDKIGSLRQQLVELEDHEKGVVDQMASAKNDLIQADKEDHAIRSSAKMIKARLLSAESAATDAQSNYTVFSNIQNEAERALRILKESTERLSSSRNMIDDRIHKYELKLTMLKTDVNASMKTLNDSRATLSRHTMKAVQAKDAVDSADGEMQKSLSHINAVYSEEHVIGTQLDRLRTEISDESGLLDNRKTELESHERHLSEAEQRLDNDRTELEAKKHAYGIYLNGTLLEMIKRVEGLEQDGVKLGRNLDTIVVNESSRPKSSPSSDESPILSGADEESPENLRNLMRETRVFLSKHGYRDALSFMEEIPASSYEDIDFIRNKSNQLIIVRELSDVDESMIEADSRLNHGLARLEIMSNDLKRIRNTMSEEESVIHKLNGSVVSLGSDVSRIQGMLDASRVHFKNESEADKLFRDSISVMESELHDATALSTRLNQSLVTQTVRVREASRDLSQRESELTGLYQTINITERIISDMTAESAKAGIILREAYATITSLQNEHENSRSASENQQRIHMEFVADISELTRRLSEMIHNIADVESTRDRIARDISSLRQQANSFLAQRITITENLEEELKVRQEFLDKKNDIDDHLNRMGCRK